MNSSLRLPREPARIGHEFSRIPLFSPATGTIQTKPAITRPGDIYEQEADRVAEQVMRMAQPAALGPAAEVVRRTCPAANGKDGADEVASDFTSRLGAGAPLDAASRSYFEPRFAHNFGSVRIHNGPQAATAAARIQARAFTIGRDVVFASGAYDPGSESGKRLLAHELTHVVQQSGAAGSPGIVCRAGPEPAPAQPEPAFQGVGNEAGAAGARIAAARLEGLVRGTAVARALATIPITDAEQKNVVIQQILNSPAVLRTHAEQGKVRSLSQEEFDTGVKTLGFPSNASAFADAENDFIYITPRGTPSAFTMGHEVSHIQTGAVRGGGADPETSTALGNLNTEVRAAFVDYAILQLGKLQEELAAGKTEDQAVAGFTQRYSSAIFAYIATGHGSVKKALEDLAKIVSARRGTDSVPNNPEELKKAVAKGFVSEADLALIFSPAVNPFLVDEPFEMEGP